MKRMLLATLTLLLAGCAHAPQLTTTLDIRKDAADLIVVKLKVVNRDSSATVPIAIEITGQAETNGHWDKSSTLLHPAAFVLNGKEERDITKMWRVPADAVRTTLVIREQERGNVLKSEKTREEVFSGAYITAVSSFHSRLCDSATPGYVMCPPYVFTPSRIAGFSRQARSRPLAHNSAR